MKKTKNFKNFTAVLLAVIFAFSIFTALPLGVGAVETTVDEVSTDDQVIYFDVAKSGWEGVKTVYCHIWAADGTGTTNTGGSWTQWQTKKECCTYDEKTGIATYKLSKVDNTFSTDDGKIYLVIFSADSGQRTYDTIMSGSCIGDTMYCTGEEIENPYDSQKACYLTKWENNDDCGAMKVITTLGNVIGTANAEGVTDADLFADYMINYYDDEWKMSNVQNVIDDEALSFTRGEVDASLETKLESDTNKDTKLTMIGYILDGCTFVFTESSSDSTKPTAETEPVEYTVETDPIEEPIFTEPTTAVTEPTEDTTVAEPVTTTYVDPNEGYTEATDEPAPTASETAPHTGTKGGEIYFDVAASGWNNVKTVYCHIWRADGTGTWPQWQTKAERCDYDSDTGIATYDLSNTGNSIYTDDGKIYCVVFSANTGMQTYNTVMSGSCIGDTMYCDGTQIENPIDSNRRNYVAVWENNSDCGPEKKITSTGNVVGTAYLEGEDDTDLLANYLICYYDDSSKTSLTQDLINTLDLNIDDIQKSVEDKLAATKNTDAEIISTVVKGILANCHYVYNDFMYDLNNDGTAYIVGYYGTETSIEISSTLRGYKLAGIDSDAFSDCKTLESINVSNDNQLYSSVDGVLYNKSKTKLVAYPAGKSDKTYTIPSSVKVIADGAFQNCQNLVILTIPSTVVSIGDDVFDGCKGVMICGVKGSAAEVYAIENNINFVAIADDPTEPTITTEIGDVSGDGTVDISDATAIQKAVAKITDLTDEQKKAADVNGDGTIDITDATTIQKFVAKIITEFTAAK